MADSLIGFNRVFYTGSAEHAIGYHSKPKEDAGNDDKIVFLEKVSLPFNTILESLLHSESLLTGGFFRETLLDELSLPYSTYCRDLYKFTSN